MTTLNGGNDQLEVFDLTRPASAQNPRRYPPVASLPALFWSDPVFLDPTHIAVVATCPSCGSQILDVDLTTGSSRQIYRSSMHVYQALYGPGETIHFLVAAPLVKLASQKPTQGGGGVATAVLSAETSSLYELTPAGVHLFRKYVTSAATAPVGWLARPVRPGVEVSFRPAQPVKGYPVLSRRRVEGYSVYVFGAPAGPGGGATFGEVTYGPDGQNLGGATGGTTNFPGKPPLVQLGGGGGGGLWQVEFAVNDARITSVQLRQDGQILDSMRPVSVGGFRGGYLLMTTNSQAKGAPELGAWVSIRQ